jgi:hypothetical protein
MRYTVTYEVNSEPFPATGKLLWAVEGVVKDEQENIVCKDNFTAWTWDKSWVQRVFKETYERWNTDPRFNQAHSGERWRDMITLP